MSELHKSRFEGDNFRKRYMSKCQGESTAEKIARLEELESMVSVLVDIRDYISNDDIIGRIIDLGEHIF